MALYDVQDIFWPDSKQLFLFHASDMKTSAEEGIFILWPSQIPHFGGKLSLIEAAKKINVIPHTSISATKGLCYFSQLLDSHYVS